jgi:hypothetical protein
VWEPGTGLDIRGLGLEQLLTCFEFAVAEGDQTCEGLLNGFETAAWLLAIAWPCMLRLRCLYMGHLHARLRLQREQ